MRTSTAGLINLDTPRFKYKPALDGVRGIGVLIVMFYHYGGDMWMHGAPILIDLFFVLSAFLITNLLLDEVNKDGAISLRGFYTRRALRLFPAMYTLLAVVAGLALLLSITGAEEVPAAIWAEIAAVALYVYNLFLGFFGFGGGTEETRVLLPLWTLSMEEWFYFFWPVALIWGLRKPRNQRVLIGGAIAFIAFWMTVRVSAGFAGISLQESGEVEDLAYPIQVLLRFSIMRPDSLVLGTLAAIVSRAAWPLDEHKERWIRIAGGIGGAYMLLVMFGGEVLTFLEPFATPGYNLGILLLLPFIIWLNYNPENRTSKLLSFSPFLWLGARSYGIYIWHGIPLILVDQLGGSVAALLVRAVILMALSIGIAELSWRFVETPFLRRKNKKHQSLSGR